MLFYTLLGLFLAIQVWDVWCSYNILSKPTGREKNKVVRWFVEKFGVLRGLLAAKLLLAAPIVIGAVVAQQYTLASVLLAALDIYYLVMLRSYLPKL